MQEDNLLRAIGEPITLVLSEILLQMDTRDNRWYSIKTNRDIIMKKTHIPDTSINRHINTLKSRGILIPTKDRGVYIVAPRFVQFGKLEE